MSAGGGGTVGVFFRWYCFLFSSTFIKHYLVVFLRYTGMIFYKNISRTVRWVALSFFLKFSTWVGHRARQVNNLSKQKRCTSTVACTCRWVASDACYDSVAPLFF